MCTLRSYIEDQLLAHPKAKNLAVDRETAERLLGDCSDCSGEGSDNDNGGPWRAMGVSELANLIGVGRSTVRGWCHAELWGPESVLMVAGDWVIPADQVELTITRYRKGWRVVRNRWVQPGAPPRPKAKDPEPGAAHGKGRKRGEKGKTKEQPDHDGPAVDQPPNYGSYEEEEDE